MARAYSPDNQHVDGCTTIQSPIDQQLSRLDHGIEGLDDLVHVLEGRLIRVSSRVEDGFGKAAPEPPRVQSQAHVVDALVSINARVDNLCATLRAMTDRLEL